MPQGSHGYCSHNVTKIMFHPILKPKCHQHMYFLNLTPYKHFHRLPFQVTNHRHKASCCRCPMISFPFPLFCLLSRWCQQLRFHATNLLQNLGFQWNAWVRMKQRNVFQKGRLTILGFASTWSEQNEPHIFISISTKGWFNGDESHGRKDMKGSKIKPDRPNLRINRPFRTQAHVTPRLSWCDETKQTIALHGEVVPANPWDVDWSYTVIIYDISYLTNAYIIYTQ